MYGGPLHNPSFIAKMLALLPSLDKQIYQTIDRIEGMLETAYDEMQLFSKDELLTKIKESDAPKGGFGHTNEAAIDHHPFYLIPSALSRTLHCQAPSDAQLRGAFRSLGYKAVRSHAKPGSIKTDAPWSAIWDIMREWVRLKAPIKEGSLKEGMAGFRIMQKQKPIQDVNRLKSQEGRKVAATSSEEAGYNHSKTTNKSLPTAGKDAQAKEDAKPRDIFDKELGEDKKIKRLVRYQMNPRANWGPMSRAK
jgi:tRNA (guanine26-N2/guanine27-N2)-dimethyltransferase